MPRCPAQQIERVFVVLPAFALAAVACIFIMYLHNILKKARVGKDLVESTTASGAESGTGPMGGELDKLSKQIKVRQVNESHRALLTV